MIIDGLVTLAASSSVPAAPVVGLMTLGVVMAVMGHMAKNPRVVGLGIAMLFLATALMMVGAFFAFQGDEVDPRPRGPEDKFP